MLLSQVFIYVKAPMHGEFSIFKMAAAAILDFQNLKFLTFGTVKRVELRNHAKFCRNRSNRGRDIAIFRIFKMADVLTTAEI